MKTSGVILAKNIKTAGLPLEEIAYGKNLTGKVLVMIHGRGATADNILSLGSHLNVAGFSLLAPQADGNTWYPYSFLSPEIQNEPKLSGAINSLDSLEIALNQMGIGSERIFFLGFSQGACLALEYTARNAKRYGGVVAFTGGLIGDKVYPEKYKGNFMLTPVFIGTSDPDPHIPVERVMETEKIFRNLNADVRVKIYKDMGHTINQDEIDKVNEFILI